MKKIILFICILLFTPSLFAWGNRAGDVTFSVGGGYYWFASKREIQNNGLGFLALGFNATDLWGIEATLVGFKTRFKDNVDFDHDKHIHATLFMLDGIYRFGDFCRFEPYVFAGAGILGLDHNRFDANNEGNINAGIGAQYYIADTLAFRADIRDVYTITGGKNDAMVDVGMTINFNLC